MIKCSVKYVLYQYAEGMIKHSVKVYFDLQHYIYICIPQIS